MKNFVFVNYVFYDRSIENNHLNAQELTDVLLNQTFRWESLKGTYEVSLKFCKRLKYLLLQQILNNHTQFLTKESGILGNSDDKRYAQQLSLGILNYFIFIFVNFESFGVRADSLIDWKSQVCEQCLDVFYKILKNLPIVTENNNESSVYQQSPILSMYQEFLRKVGDNSRLLECLLEVATDISSHSLWIARKQMSLTAHNDSASSLNSISDNSGIKKRVFKTTSFNPTYVPLHDSNRAILPIDYQLLLEAVEESTDLKLWFSNVTRALEILRRLFWAQNTNIVSRKQMDRTLSLIVSNIGSSSTTYGINNNSSGSNSAILPNNLEEISYFTLICSMIHGFDSWSVKLPPKLLSDLQITAISTLMEMLTCMSGCSSPRSLLDLIGWPNMLGLVGMISNGLVSALTMKGGEKAESVSGSLLDLLLFLGRQQPVVFSEMFRVKGSKMWLMGRKGSLQTGKGESDKSELKLAKFPLTESGWCKEI